MNKIKFNLLIPLIIIISLFFSLFGCINGKYFSDGFTLKKSVDTLAIFPPVTIIKSINNTTIKSTVSINGFTLVQGQKQGRISGDSILSKKIKDLIYKKSQAILSHKYKLEINSIICDSLTENDLSTLFWKIDEPNAQLSKIETPEFIRKKLKHTTKQYCVVFFFKGTYDSQFEPDFVAKSALGGKLYLNLKVSAMSELRILIFENVKNTIVHYEKVVSSNDPRLPERIEEMTSNILRKIYYK